MPIHYVYALAFRVRLAKITLYRPITHGQLVIINGGAMAPIWSIYF